jgi:hypothetical protein
MLCNCVLAEIGHGSLAAGASRAGTGAENTLELGAGRRFKGERQATAPVQHAKRRGGRMRRRQEKRKKKTGNREELARSELVHGQTFGRSGYIDAC